MLATTVAIVSILAAAPPTSFAQHEQLELRAATPNTTSVACYGLFELTIDLKATYDNPFNPDDVDVYAIFQGPDGTTRRVNGFLAQPHTRRLEEKYEHIEPAGPPIWSIRFAPNREGEWKYRVTAKDRSGSVSLAEAAMTATASKSAGFIRVDRRDPHLFAFDNGRPFFAIGENMCWPGGRGTYDYDDWLGELGRAGGNWIRLWSHRWNCCLEWGATGKPDWDKERYEGLGVYNLASAWKLDAILDIAEKNGVYMMLTLGTYGELMDGGFFNEGLWEVNPLNAANGGPCAKPDEVWTNESARKLYRQRLRYVAARYGWRSSLFAWEFWNEAKAPAPWVQEMAQFLKGEGPFAGAPADPYKHLVSNTWGAPDVWRLPEVDFTQTHHYGEGNIPDSGPVIHADAAGFRAYGKPHLMAEFGIDWRSSDDKYDASFQGVNLHNGLWASALSGNAGGAMIWYWDSYVHPGKLYPHFAALRKFTDAIPWEKGPWNSLAMDAPTAKVDTETWRDLVLMPVQSWAKNEHTGYTVKPLDSANDTPLPTFLYGPLKPELRTPLVFNVNYATNGRFEVHVNAVSGGATLQIRLDGVSKFDKAFSATPPDKEGVTPEYESTKLRPEYKSYEARFNKRYGIDVPSGAHTITVDVTDGDWLNTSSYTFTKYISSRYPHMNAYGITNGTMACLWLQNAGHTWKAVRDNTPAAPITNATVTVRGLPPGQYACTWWDTAKGEPMRTDPATCADNALVLAIPDLDTDIAARVEAP